MATSRDPNSHEGRLEIIRNAATIASLFLAIPSVISTNPGADLLGASMDTIATFAYPVWDKQQKGFDSFLTLFLWPPAESFLDLGVSIPVINI